MTQDEEHEEEANIFAMHLLVPTPFLEEDLRGHEHISLTDDKWIRAMASRYDVSITVMLIRIREVLAQMKKKR